MAEMTKKLHFLRGGAEQTAKAYSTTAEAGSSYITNVIDGVTCYVPIGATNDAQATYGRVLKDGITYAIKSQAKPAYAEKSWTSPGTYTWTAPAGVTRVRVAVCGGGGGGLACGSSGSSGSGSTSTFGNLISATGGEGCKVNHDEYWNGDNHYDIIGSHGGRTGGSPNGYSGGYKTTRTAIKDGFTVSNTKGFALSFTKTDGNYGYGGGASSYISHPGGDEYYVGAGGSGGYNSEYVNVSSGNTYSIVVASGGAGKSTLNSSGWEHYNFYNSGNSGFVLIAYGGDI